MYERVAPVRAEDFICSRITASAFVVTEGFRPPRLLPDLLRDWGTIYDADPVALPLPPGVPGHIPSVILSSRDNVHRLELAQERINLVWSRQPEQTANVQQTLREFAGRLASILTLGRTEAGRLAAIAVRSADHPRPGMSLAQRFCREEYLDGALNRPEGFELHAHKVFALLPDLRVNSWMRIKTAQGGESRYVHAVVEQDINTLAEEAATQRFSDADILRFFDAASAELDVILQAYFPAPQLLEG